MVNNETALSKNCENILRLNKDRNYIYRDMKERKTCIAQPALAI